MKQYYESELIKEIVEARGHKKSSPHYESECIESWVEEVKGAYPKLCDYESEWLNYISILDDMGGVEDPEPPIGEFPYVVLSDVTQATIDNVVPYAYKNAILKGKTDENLQSVRMPVLTTTGKNLFDKSKVKYNTSLSPSNGEDQADVRYMSSDFINVEPNKKYVSSHMGVIFYYDENKKMITIMDSPQLPQIFTTPNNCKYVRLKCWEHYSTIEKQREIVELEQLEEGSNATAYEPYKSIILTVNEPVDLRGIGNVRDELNCLTGEVTERIGEIVFDGTEEWTRPVVFTNTVRYMSPKLENYKLNSKNVIMGNLPHIYNHNLDEPHCAIDLSGYLLVFIPKTEMEDTTVNSVKKYFQKNNAKFQYELKTPTIKTVDLTIVNQDGKTLSTIKPIEGKMFLSTSSDTIKPLFSGEIPVEAITQNLSSFIDLEMEE